MSVQHSKSTASNSTGSTAHASDCGDTNAITNLPALIGTTFTYVWHCADLHIRLSTRHVEYRECFDWLINRIGIHKRKLPDAVNSIVVVSGDIFHSKCELTPEAIALAKHLFRNIPYPVIVIAGNHDANLSNSSRLDALSPILDDIPNVHYLSQSGLYRAGNIVFGVSSILDKGLIAMPKRRIPGCHYAALYHGLVHGSVNDVGVRLNAERSIVDFDGWDYGFFGDNHTSQSLRPGLAYPGSLIQQTFAETGFHGILRWELGSHIATRIAVPNNWGYHRIEIINGEIAAASMSTVISEHPRIQLLVRSGTSAQVAEIEQTLRRDHRVEWIESVIEKRETEHDMGILRALTTGSFLPATMLSRYLEQKKIPADRIERIVKLHKQWRRDIVGDVTNTGGSVNGRWRPIRMTFDNLLSYKGCWEIDFLSGLVGLFGPNDSGKSSIIDILVFALFDRPIRGDKKADIITRGEKSFRILLDFEHGGRSYRVYREGHVLNRGLTVTTKFWRIDTVSARTQTTPMITNLTGKDRNDTNRIIEGIVGSMEETMNIGICLQAGGTGFVDETPGKRKERINRILNLDKFDKLSDKISDEKRASTAELKVLGASLSADDLFNLEQECEALSDQIKKLKKRKVQWDADCTEFAELIAVNSDDPKQEIAELTQQLTTVQRTLDSMPSGTADVNHLKRLTHELAVTTALEAEVRGDRSNCAPMIDATADMVRLTQLSDKYAGIHTLLDRYTTGAVAQKHKTTVDRELAHARTAVKRLSAHRYDPKCTFCCNNDFVKEAELLKHKLPNLEAESDRLTAQLRDQDAVDTDANEYRAIMNRMWNDDVEHTCDARMRALRAETTLTLRGHHLSRQHIQAQIDDQHRILDSAKHRDALTHEQRCLSARIALLHEFIDKRIHDKRATGRTLQERLLTATHQHGVLMTKLGAARLTSKRVHAVTAIIDDLMVYAAAVNRDGIPKQLASQLIPQLEHDINTIVCPVGNFRITIDPVTSSISQHKEVGGTTVITDAQLACGSNKLLIELALRSVVATMTCGTSPNILILDESMYSLDGERTAFIDSIFNSIRQHFDTIFLITHSPLLKSSVDTQIHPKHLRKLQWKTLLSTNGYDDTL